MSNFTSNGSDEGGEISTMQREDLVSYQLYIINLFKEQIR